VEGETSPVVQRLLKGVWVVKDLKETVELRSDDNHQLFVTNEGTVLYPSGMVTGGNKESLDSGILKRKRRIREVTRSIHHLEKDYGEQVKAYQETCGHLAEAKKDLAALQEEIQELALSVIHKERDGIQAEEGLRETEQRLKLLHLEEEEIESLIQETKNEYTNVQGVKEEKEKTKCEKESTLHDLQDSLQGMEEAMQKEEGEITLLKINQASLREKREHCLSLLLSKKDQLDNLLARIESIQKKVRDEEERGKVLEAALNEAQDALDDLIQSEQILKKKVDEEKELAQQGLEYIHQMEEKLKELRKMFMDVQPRLNEMNLKLTEYHLNMHHLKNDIQEKYHLDLEPLWEEFSCKRGEADAELAEILQRLKAKLENFGEVNLMAQQELDELQKRYAFLSQQHEDLEQTMESLKKVINKINATIRDKFLDTFNAVNEKFKEIFPKLFRGGKAELILSEESDILETGIEIIAQPPGKRLQNMDLLSGGEKSMTAVALLLALFMVKPSPFCLLDEVDSPLDDMNTFLFIEQLKEMAGNDSKFILITHNKKTMEAANTLYGITMEEKGITKVVSVKLN
jgi:chromosome segregation protein